MDGCCQGGNPIKGSPFPTSLLIQAASKCQPRLARPGRVRFPWARIAFGAWPVVNDWGRKDVEYPCQKDAGTGDPSWCQSRGGKASGTYRCAAACARRLLSPFVLLSALWLLGVQNRNLRRKLGPCRPGGPGIPRQTHRYRGLLSFLSHPSSALRRPPPRSPTGFVGKVYS